MIERAKREKKLIFINTHIQIINTNENTDKRKITSGELERILKAAPVLKVYAEKLPNKIRAACSIKTQKIIIEIVKSKIF